MFSVIDFLNKYNYKIYDLAEKINIHPGYLGKIINGNLRITRPIAFRISQETNLDFDQLLKEGKAVYEHRQSLKQKEKANEN